MNSCFGVIYKVGSKVSQMLYDKTGGLHQHFLDLPQELSLPDHSSHSEVALLWVEQLYHDTSDQARTLPHHSQPDGESLSSSRCLLLSDDCVL